MVPLSLLATLDHAEALATRYGYDDALLHIRAAVRAMEARRRKWKATAKAKAKVLTQEAS
jgi:hypothetical protein